MKHAFVLVAILAVFAFLVRGRVFPWPYYYDEADYMFAASLGWRSNYTDNPSQSLIDFVRAGLRRGDDSSSRASLSADARSGSDVNFYRHWHGPLYFYWLDALAQLHLDARATRSLSYIFPAVTALVIYCGSLSLLPPPVGGLAAFLATTLYLWSYPPVFSNEIAPHQLFVLFVVTGLVLLMKWRVTATPRYWYGAVAAAACAFCTLEVAFVLLAVMIGFVDKRRAANSALLFLAIVFALWPAALIRLTFVKAYFFMAYLALFRRSPWGSVGFLETWRIRLMQSPAEWLLLGIAAILYFRFCDSATRRLLAPAVLYGCVMLAVLLRVNTETPRYMLPFLPAFHLAAGIAFASVMKNWKPALRAGAMVAISALTLLNTYGQIRAHPIRPAPRLAEVLARVHDAKLDGKKLLAPQNDVPMIHYYLPGVGLTGYVNAQERGDLEANRSFDAILFEGYPVNLERLSPGSSHYVSQR